VTVHTLASMKVLAVENGHQLASGDKCPRRKCKDYIRVVKSEVKGSYRIRYLGCKSCGYRPAKNKQIVPLEYAPARWPEVYDA